MKKIVVVNSFVQDLLLLIDKGEGVELGKIKEEVFNGTLFPFLKQFSKEYSKQYEMYFYYFKEDEIRYLNSELYNYVDAYSNRENRKLGISNNGLVLLAFYAVQLIRELDKNEEIQ